MQDKRVLEVIHSTASSLGTPAFGVEALVGRLRPSIRLVPQEPDGEPQLGGCRVGGCPDLPAKVRWPRLSTAWDLDPTELEDADDPLPFLMQINLAEVAPLDVEGVLPKAGMLYFFFYWEEGGGDEADVPYVLFLPEAKRLRRLKPPDDLAKERVFRPLDLLPKLEWTIPSINDVGLEEEDLPRFYQFWEDVEERVAEAQGIEPANGPGVAHRLLGHAQFIQSPGMADGTRLLLQVDSDSTRGDYPKSGMMWGDCGRIYYILSEEELRSHQFSEAEASMEMC